MSRTTFAREAAYRGVGIHSGEEISLRLCPTANPGGGIVFVRDDLPGAPRIAVGPDALGGTDRATTLGVGDSSVATVEHLLAALYSFEIDDALVIVDGPEVPAADGSAAPFVALVETAGRSDLPGRRESIRIREPVEVRDGDRWARIEPSGGFAIDYTIDFAHPLIGEQRFSCDALDAATFAKEIAPARTFGFVSELPDLAARALARGGALDNALLLDDTGLVNRCELHWPDEFVRHKVIDLIGDLALAGVPIVGRVRVHKGGHALHQALLAALLATPGALA